MNETTTRIQKDYWTKNQDTILTKLASKPWRSKIVLLEAIATKIPKVSATAALRHAMKHQKLKFNYGMSVEARAEINDLLRQNIDSGIIRDQIHRNHGFLRSTTYYSKLRFIANRGPYVVVYDPGTKKSYFEHREVMADALVETEGITKKAARKKLINKDVTHSTSFSVTNNELENIFTTTGKTRGKIRDINAVTLALGLEFGSLLSLIAPEDLETKTAISIVTELFEEAGLTVDARKYFG